MLTRMDAAQALADLTEISSQVIQVAIFGPDRSLLASTIAEPAAAARFCAELERLETEADLQAKLGGLGGPLTQLEVSALEGSVFVVRSRPARSRRPPDPTRPSGSSSTTSSAVSKASPRPPARPTAPGRRRRPWRPRAPTPHPPPTPSPTRSRAVRKVVSVSLLGAGLVAGSAGYRRRTGRRVERVELYGQDGSLLSLAAGPAEGERLLLLARELLALSQ